MLTTKELRKLKPEDLEKELQKALVKKTQSSIELRSVQDKKSHSHKEWKKYCARILTVKNEGKEEEVKEEKKEEKKSKKD